MTSSFVKSVKFCNMSRLFNMKPVYLSHRTTDTSYILAPRTRRRAKRKHARCCLSQYVRHVETSQHLCSDTQIPCLWTNLVFLSFSACLSVCLVLYFSTCARTILHSICSARKCVLRCTSIWMKPRCVCDYDRWCCLQKRAVIFSCNGMHLEDVRFSFSFFTETLYQRIFLFFLISVCNSYFTSETLLPHSENVTWRTSRIGSEYSKYSENNK